MAALWTYFAGSVAGNVGHAPRVLAAQLVAAVPPLSAALTFHLLLRLLDRAPALRAIAETYEERSVEEQERAAVRKARRARIKSAPPSHSARASSTVAPASAASKPGDGHTGSPMADRHQSNGTGRDASPGRATTSTPGRAEAAARDDELRRRVRAAIDNDEPVTGETVGQWLGLSARTGRRRLAALLNDDSELARAASQDDRK
jgi:hypothetical protein